MVGMSMCVRAQEKNYIHKLPGGINVSRRRQDGRTINHFHVDESS